MADKATPATDETQDMKATSAGASKGQGKSDAPAAENGGPSDKKGGGKGDDEASNLGDADKPREVTLGQYLRVSGKKADQTAGFAAYAAIENLGRKTVDAWSQALVDFDARPIR